MIQLETIESSYSSTVSMRPIVVDDRDWISEGRSIDSPQMKSLMSPSGPED